MKCPSYFTGAILGFALAMTAYAKPGVIDDASPAAKQRAKVYIVQMASDPIAAYEGSIPGLRQTKPVKGRKVDADSADAREYAAHLNANHDAVLSAVGGRKIYDYNVVFNGFAAVLTPDQVQAMQARGDVLKVWEDELLQPHTNSTPDFLDLTGGGDPWSKGYVGEDVVIG
ncbi:MAG: protease inhibitor I9 family protein, partial [Gammaproteobacteria bacterium]|nr:protease inhibitor I9 family protein [Gammaproteobacteria bacterium]